MFSKLTLYKLLNAWIKGYRFFFKVPVNGFQNLTCLCNQHETRKYMSSVSWRHTLFLHLRCPHKLWGLLLLDCNTNELDSMNSSIGLLLLSNLLRFVHTVRRLVSWYSCTPFFLSFTGYASTHLPVRRSFPDLKGHLQRCCCLAAQSKACPCSLWTWMCSCWADSRSTVSCA